MATVQFNCVGCIQKGAERTAYILQRTDNKQNRKVDRYTMAVLVGRGAVLNTTSQIYKDGVIYRGIGCDFSKLPTLKCNEDGTKKTKEQLVDEAKSRKSARVRRIQDIENRKVQKQQPVARQQVQQTRQTAKRK